MEIVWAEKSPAPRCGNPLRSMRCDGLWSEMRGENEKVGWLWVCANGDCPAAIKAASIDIGTGNDAPFPRVK